MALYEKLCREMPGRESEMEQLIQALGSETGDEAIPAVILVSGLASTGKSACVRGVLHALKIRYAELECAELVSSSSLYRTVGEALIPGAPLCRTLRELVLALTATGSSTPSQTPLVLVLNGAERLRRTPAALHAALGLRRLSNINICVILISRLLCEHLEVVAASEPISIYFRNYSRDSLLNILKLSHKSFVSSVLEQYPTSNVEQISDSEFFGNFLVGFLSVFYRPCRDLTELKHLARIIFVYYCEPVVTEVVDIGDLNKLWKMVSDVMKKHLELLYLRINPDNCKVPYCDQENRTDKLNKKMDLYKSSNQDLAEQLCSSKCYAQSFELPYNTKFLLIAAYLASFNPPNHDKRLFAKNHGKQKKRQLTVNSKAKVTEKLRSKVGPKIFALERLLNIYLGLLEEEAIIIGSKIIEQVSMLVHLRLIAEVSCSGDQALLDSPSYRCVVGMQFVSAVADTVNFKLKKYLYQFT